jgi:hypothetical protein
VRLKNRVGLWAVAALTLTLAGGAPALAQTRTDAPVERRPAIASFEGGVIDLAGDWGDAQACLVWRQGGVLECFRTVAELDAREAELEPLRSRSSSRASGGGGGTVASSTAEYSCWSSLRLYEYNYYGGRRLSFWDRGYWQNLYIYGFDNQTSSYIVGACYVHLAEHTDGGGWWYPGPTYPYAGEPVMHWQDVISSIYIE